MGHNFPCSPQGGKSSQLLNLHFTLVFMVTVGIIHILLLTGSCRFCRFCSIYHRKLKWCFLIRYLVYSINYFACFLITYLAYTESYHVCSLITTRTNQSEEINHSSLGFMTISNPRPWTQVFMDHKSQSTVNKPKNIC